MCWHEYALNEDKKRIVNLARKIPLKQNTKFYRHDLYIGQKNI